MEFEEKTNAKQLLASLSPEALGSLADLIVSKLKAIDNETLLSKQVVTGSNPVSRCSTPEMTVCFVLHVGPGATNRRLPLDTGNIYPSKIVLNRGGFPHQSDPFRVDGCLLTITDIKFTQN